jgi:KaiC/GvpD/RAD55 family RecA-like ATPase
MHDVTASTKQTTTHPAAGVGSLPDAKQPQQDLYLESLENLPIQCKLAIGAVDDPLETEADSMADRVMRMPEQNFIQRKNASSENEEKLQRKIEAAELPPQAKLIDSTSFIQRKCTECERENEETLRRKPLSELITPFIQTKSDEASSVGDSLNSQIQGSRWSGSSLDKNTQTFMESRFGADFSSVRIHTGSESIQMNKELNAQAFTVGNNVYFNEGKYQPNATEGKHLLAHELAHTIQQGVSSNSSQLSMRHESAASFFKASQKQHSLGSIVQPNRLLRSVSITQDAGYKIQRKADPESLTEWQKLPESIFVVIKEDVFFSEAPGSGAIFQSRVLIKGEPLELTWKKGDWFFGFSEDGTKGYVQKTSLVFPPDKMPVEEYVGVIGDILFIQAKNMHRAFVLAKKSGLKPNIGMVFWYSNGKVKPYPVNYEITIRDPSAEELERMQLLAGFSSLGGSGTSVSKPVSGGAGSTSTPEQKKWKEAEKVLEPYANEYLLAESKKMPGEMLMNVPNESYFEYFNLYDRFCNDKGIKKDPSNPDYEYYNQVLQLLIRAKIKEVMTTFAYKPTDKMLVTGSMEWWVSAKQLLVIDNDAFLKAGLEKIIAEENEKRKLDVEVFFKPYKDRFKVEQDEFLAKAKSKIDSISGWYQQEVERKAAMEILKQRQDEYMAKAMADFQQSTIAKEIQAAVEKRYAALEKTVTYPDPYSHAVIKADTVLIGMLKLYDQKIADAKDSAAQTEAFVSLRDKIGTYLSTTYPDQFKSLLRVMLVYYSDKLLVRQDGKISIYAIKNWARINSKDLATAIERFAPVYYKRFNKDLEFMRLMDQHSMTTQAYTDLTYELMYAKEFFDKVIEHPESDEGFWDGFFSKSLADFIPFVHSIINISKLYEVMRVSNKSLMGGTLTVSEQLILQAFAALQQIEAMKAKPFWYKVGEGVADAIPFIGEFVITAPLGLGTAAVTEKAMEATVRKLAVQYLEKRMVKFIIKGVGVLAGSLVQTLANPLDIEKNILANKMNIVSLVPNEDGSITVEVQANKESEASAVWNGFIASYINVFTERLGGKVLPFVGSKVAGAFSRFVPMVVRDKIVTASMKKVAESLSKYAGFHGILGEYEEEVYGQVLEALLTGKQLKWNKEDQLQTFAVVAVLGTAMRGLQATIVAYEIMRTFRFNNKNIVLPAEIYTRLTRLTNEKSFESFKEELAAMKLSTDQRELALMLAQQTLNLEHEISLSEKEVASLQPKAELPKTLKQLHQLIIGLYKVKKNMLVQLQQGKRVAESVLLFGDAESVPLILYNVDQTNQWIMETETAIENLEGTDLSDAKKMAGVADGVIENVAFWTNWAAGWRPYIQQVIEISPDSKVNITDDLATVNINGNMLLTPRMLQRLLLLDKQNLEKILTLSLRTAKAESPAELSAENLTALADAHAKSSVSIADNGFVNINNGVYLSKALLEQLLPEDPKAKGKKLLSPANFLFSHSGALDYINNKFTEFTPEDLLAVKNLDPDSTVLLNADNRLDMNGHIDVSASFIKELMAKNSADVKKLLEATLALNKTGGSLLTLADAHRKIIIYFSSSSGYRMRFKFQYDTELNTFLSNTGANTDPRFQSLWANASVEAKIRLWDLYNEIAGYNVKGARAADKIPEMRKQAMDFALSMTPVNIFELVDYYQYYKSYFSEEMERLKGQYKADLEKAMQDYKTANAVTDIPAKEKEKIEINISTKEFGVGFKGASSSLNEAVYNKVIEQMRGNVKGTGFISEVVLKNLNAMFQLGRTQVTGKLGKGHITPGLNDQDTVKAVQRIDNLSFAEETAAVYHVLKHHHELPGNLQDNANPAKAYIEAARKTVKEAKQVEVSFAAMEFGTRNIRFALPYVAAEGSFELTAFVRCNVNGEVYIATLMIKKL